MYYLFLNSTKLTRVKRHVVAPSVMITVGVAFISAWCMARIRATVNSEPGRLVAKRAEMTWQSTSKSHSKPLAGEAEAIFEVDNIGGQPVKILSVESSCGCSVPRIQPTTIMPGGEGKVHVQVTPPSMGERIADITLHTDSPLNPTIGLRLRVLGRRRPPFLLQAGGELTFICDTTTEEFRELIVIMVEPLEESRAPIVVGDTALMEISSPTCSVRPYTEPGVVQRTYKYQIKLKSKPPLGTLSGEVKVMDPWDRLNVERVGIQGRILPPFRVVPARLVLRVKRATTSTAEVRFLVRTKSGDPRFVVEANQDANCPLEVSRIGTQADDRTVIYAVHYKPGRIIQGGEYDIVVRSLSSSDRVTVPVAILVEDDR